MAPLRILGSDDVDRVLPSLREQMDLVEHVFREHAAGRVQLPPKPAVHPRSDSFVHAMPAYVSDPDVVAVKWIAGYRQNKRRGLPYLSGIIVVNDPETGLPTSVVEAGRITRARTAAVSALCVERLAPAGWRHAGLVGCGEQGHAHAEMLAALNPDLVVTAYDPHPERVEALPVEATCAPTARDAVHGAEIVVTAAPMPDAVAPELTSDDLATARLVLPVDFDASIRSDVAASAELVIVDDVGQFDHYRRGGRFSSWPDPTASLGEALGNQVSESERSGQVMCVNLGIGATDAVMAAVVVARALDAGLGTEVDL